ncbi:MAG: thioredoxin family protein [Candidatus Bilamarchaeum sp.]|jgi:thiol-disulfide isomerase/thioredoxin
MQIEKKSLLLIISVVLIVVAIIYIQSTKLPVSRSSLSLAPISGGQFPNAPEISGGTGFINTNSSLSLSGLKGKVVLIDFWTYSCINCIRTLPYLKAWNEKYSDNGLVIIGVHTPEFDFEKVESNVRAAVSKFGIKYPVIMDNNYVIWNSYSNHYWPHIFLIDSTGKVRYDHIGEGNDVETEQQIQQLLKEAGNSSDVDLGNIVSSNIPFDSSMSQIATPEIYLGYNFARSQLGNLEGFSPENTVSYTPASQLVPNLVYLNGSWKNNPDNMELVSDSGQVSLYYKAGKVHVVAGSENGSMINVLLDDKKLNSSQIGADSSNNSSLTIRGLRLYTLVDGDDYSPHIIKFNVSGKGFRIYTFTFG